MRTKRWIGWTLAAALPLWAGCQPAEETEEMEPTAMEEPAPAEETMDAVTPRTAAAELAGPDGAAMGVVTFIEEAGGVHVVARLEGLPAGEHGFHVHETGDCSAADFTSAGGHFNPAGTVHACPPTTPRHAGDFGNVTIGDDGMGDFDATSDLISLGDGADSVVGQAVIVHSGADDCFAQPTGAAGDRLACGVIEPAAATIEGETDEPAATDAGDDGAY